MIGLAAAASIAVAVLVGPPGQVAAAGEQEIQAAMERSQALESALSQYHPEERMLDGRTAGIAQELEDRIARVDRELEMAELLNASRATTSCSSSGANGSACSTPWWTCTSPAPATWGSEPRGDRHAPRLRLTVR